MGKNPYHAKDECPNYYDGCHCEEARLQGRITDLESRLAAATERAEKAEADCAALREAIEQAAYSLNETSHWARRIGFSGTADGIMHDAELARAALASPHPREKMLAVVEAAKCFRNAWLCPATSDSAVDAENAALREALKALEDG